MFHQVFICNSSQDSDCSRNITSEQNSVNDAPLTVKEENITSANTIMGYVETDDMKMAVVETDDVKMAVGELKLEKCTPINNQIVIGTDAQITKVDLDAKNFLNVTPTCSNSSSPGQLIQQQAAVIQSLVPSYVYQPSVENIVLQPQPILVNINGNIMQLPAVSAPMQTAAVAVSTTQGINTGLGLQSVPNPTMKIELCSSLGQEVMNTSVAELAGDSEVKIKREEPMEYEPCPHLADSEDTSAQSGGIILKGHNGFDGLRVCQKLIIKKDVTSSFEEKKDSLFKEGKSAKSHENISVKIINSRECELNKMLCSENLIVTTNDSLPEYITPELILEHDVENIDEPSLKEEDSSSSGLDDDHSIGDSSESDWEKEYLNTFKEKKLKNNSCKSILNPLINTNSITQPTTTSSGMVLNNSSKSILSPLRNTNSITQPTSSGMLLSNGGPSDSITCNMTSISSNSLYLKESVSKSKNKILPKDLNIKDLVTIPANNDSAQLNQKNNICQIQSTTSAEKNTFLVVPNCGQIQDFQKNTTKHIQYQTLVLTGPIDLHKNKDKKEDNTNLQTLEDSNQNKTITSPHKIQEITNKDGKLNFKNILPKPNTSYTFGVLKAPLAIEESSPSGSSKDGKIPPEKELTSHQYLYQCKECNICFKALEQFLYHKKSSLCFEKKQEVDSYQCNICGKCLANSKSLEAHQTVHTNERPFKCSFCDERFKCKKAKSLHFKKKHSDTNYSSKRYMCSVCGYSSTKLKYLLDHEEIHRLPKGAEIPKPFGCQECGKHFRHPRGLRNHIIVHSNPTFFCDICDKVFKTKRNLQQHMITHSNARPISCLLCGDRFKRPAHLKQHMNGVHGKGRNH